MRDSLFNTPPTLFRGSTLVFLSSFFDQDGNPTTPTGAVVSVQFPCDDGQPNTAQIDMVPPGSPGGDVTYWSAQWDTRSINPGIVYYSIHTTDPVPLSVEDGQFVLAANRANLPTF